MKQSHQWAIIAILVASAIIAGVSMYNRHSKQQELASHYRSRIDLLQYEIEISKPQLECLRNILKIERESTVSTQSAIRDAERKVKEAEDRVEAKKAEIRQYEDKIRELGFK